MEKELRSFRITLPLRGNLPTGTVLEDSEKFLYVVQSTLCRKVEKGYEVCGIKVRALRDTKDPEEINFGEGEELNVVITGPIIY